MILLGIILRKLRLSDSQKLMVFLGGMNIIGRELLEIGTVEEKEEMEGMKENRSRAIEIARAEEQTRKKAVEELRVQIVDMLDRSGEVKDISDMFKEPPSLIDFNPIMFVMHLPISLQRAHQGEPNGAEVEDFGIVYDGRIVMVSVVCSLEKRPWGVYDVRDRLLKMMKTVVPNFEMTSPCLTHEAIAFVNNPEEVHKDRRDIYLKIEPEEAGIDALRRLYVRLNPEIMFFYAACEISENTTKLAWEIQKYEKKLFWSLKEFLAATWRHPFERTKSVRQMKKHAARILEGLSNRSSLARELKKIRSKIEERRAHNSLFDSFIEKVHFDEYTKTETVDVESLMRIIENVRSETETYSSFISTLVSTLIGAIIGSALTIIVSYIFGIL